MKLLLSADSIIVYADAPVVLYSKQSGDTPEPQSHGFYRAARTRIMGRHNICSIVNQSDDAPEPQSHGLYRAANAHLE